MEYNYNKFLSDSSDDEKFVISQADDDMNYQQAYSQTEIRTALENVLALAGMKTKPVGDYAEEQIKIVKDYFFNSGQAVFNNSKIAKSDKDK